MEQKSSPFHQESPQKTEPEVQVTRNSLCPDPRQVRHQRESSLLKYRDLPSESHKTHQEDQLEVREAHTFENGAVYSGSWLRGLPEGHGVQVWPDGARYEGMWHQGRARGQGTFLSKIGDKYTGEWLDDQMHGNGVSI